MCCHKCGKKLTQYYLVLRHSENFAVSNFCGWDCLRAYLPPPAPLTDRINQAQKPAPSPQDVVVDPECHAVHPGESHETWQKATSNWLKRIVH